MARIRLFLYYLSIGCSLSHARREAAALQRRGLK